MSHIRHYRMLSWEIGPLTRWRVSLKYQTGKVAKNGQIICLPTSMIIVEAITTIQREKRHKPLGTALTACRDHSTRTILQWFTSTLMLILSAIRHFVRTELFIACMPPAGSSTEHVLTYSLLWKMKTATAKPKVKQSMPIYSRTTRKSLLCPCYRKQLQILAKAHEFYEALHGGL